MKRFHGIAIVSLLALTVGTASGQTVVRPGFNVFSVDQDVEIGKQSAAQVEQQLAGQQSLTVQLAGRSSDRAGNERVTVVARMLPDEHVVYMLLIAPDAEYAALTPTFDRMVRSFRSDEHATHN